MCTSSYWRKYQFGSFIQCRNTTFRCTTLNHLRVNIKHFLGPILGAEVAQKRAPFPQSRFSFDCKRMDSVASIRHESNTERISKSAYLRRFQQSRFEHFTWCLRGLYAQKENSREDCCRGSWSRKGMAGTCWSSRYIQKRNGYVFWCAGWKIQAIC